MDGDSSLRWGFVTHITHFSQTPVCAFSNCQTETVHVHDVNVTMLICHSRRLQIKLPTPQQ